MLFLCYPGCSTCTKAEQWLITHGIRYEKRNIRTERPSVEELAQWVQKSGLPLKRFFNTSGQSYRSLGLKERLSALSEEEQLALLAADGMLVRRPLLIDEEKVLVGFRASEYETLLS